VQRPYTAFSNTEVVEQVCGSTAYRLPRPTHIVIPDELWTLMQRCWLKEVDKRPSFEYIYIELEGIANAIRAASANNNETAANVDSKTGQACFLIEPVSDFVLTISKVSPSTSSNSVGSGAYSSTSKEKDYANVYLKSPSHKRNSQRGSKQSSTQAQLEEGEVDRYTPIATASASTSKNDPDPSSSSSPLPAASDDKKAS